MIIGLLNFFIILTHLKKTYSNLDINLTDSIGNSALHFAVKENYIDNVKELFKDWEIKRYGSNLYAEEKIEEKPKG